MMNNKAQSQETFAQPCAKNEHLAELGGCGNRSDGKDSAVNSKKEREKSYLSKFLDTKLMKDNGINEPED